VSSQAGVCGSSADTPAFTRKARATPGRSDQLEHACDDQVERAPNRQVAEEQRTVVLGLGYTLFLGSLIWIATFPVSLTV
jgi:hypothetical protein